jgi:glycosyltransferase involved in cell wall biosynthesis
MNASRKRSAGDAPEAQEKMRVAIFIPAYQAEATLADVVRRIPRSVYERVDEILIQDDASTDRTVEVARRLAREYAKIRVVCNASNLGYGGTKKKAYRALINAGFDAVVMLHGDGQLPPEALGSMLAPILRGDVGIVLGSRILSHPLRGGMPLYKYLGNRALTIAMNRTLNLNLTDYHTGYRAYACHALARLEPESCSDGHEISSELLFRAADLGIPIAEVPVATWYGEGSRSMSFGKSALYGIRVLRMALRHRSGIAQKEGNLGHD